MAKVRMYVQKGCPHCDTAKSFLQDRGVTVEAIEIGFDPILSAGIRSFTQGGNFQIPLTISYLTDEIISGSNSEHLQRIVDSFSAIAPNSSS